LALLVLVPEDGLYETRLQQRILIAQVAPRTGIRAVVGQMESRYRLSHLALLVLVPEDGLYETRLQQRILIAQVAPRTGLRAAVGQMESRYR